VGEELRLKLDYNNVPITSNLALELGDRTLRFLYDATSGFLHFNIPEIMRGAGYLREQELVLIDSSRFNLFWSMFSLFWGWWIYRQTLGVVMKIGKEQGWTSDIDERQIDEFNRNIKRYDKDITEHGFILALSIDDLLPKSETEKLYEGIKLGAQPVFYSRKNSGPPKEKK
jgi:hypothetical protein